MILKRYIKLDVVFLFFFSFLVHILIFFDIGNFPQIKCPYPSSDGDFYIFISKFIDGNLDIVSKEPFYYSPLYAYLSNITLNIFNYNTFYLQIFNIMLGSLVPVFVYLTAKLFFKDSKIIFFVTFLSVFFDTFLLYDLTILKTTTGILLISSGIYFLSKFFFYKNKKDLVFSSIFLGLSSLIYANMLLFIAVVFLYLLIKNVRLSIYFLIPAFIVVLITLVRNYTVSKDFIPITAIGGIHFYIGNNFQSKGIYTHIPGIRPSGFGHYFDAKKIAERETGKKLKPSEVSNFWKEKTITGIKEHPEHFVKLLIKKLWYTFNYFDIPNNINKNYIKAKSKIYKNISISYGIIALLGLTGFILSLRKKEFFILNLFFIVYTFSIVLFFVNDRYRLPLAIPMFIYAGYTTYLFFKGDWKSKLKTGALMTIVALLVFYKTDISRINYGTLSQRFEKMSEKLCYLNKKLSSAKTNKEKSIILTEIATVYLKTKSYEQAFYLAKEAFRLNKRNKVAFYLMKNAKRYIEK